MALRAITTRTSAAKQRGQKWRDGALDSYRRVAFRIERWYWLNKIAYEQSSWPATLRLVRGVLLGLLVLALALWLWKMNLDEKENERRQPYYELAPRYQAWSVSKITYEG
ncbi:hypothetical protein GGR54DRAFT_583306 [Hypoxylon sp. NC1633]|nr:hypothetical protein GGR54DRAFT_583306 [Hypoxylon sp. NC1633]